MAVVRGWCEFVTVGPLEDVCPGVVVSRRAVTNGMARRDVAISELSASQDRDVMRGGDSWRSMLKAGKINRFILSGTFFWRAANDRQGCFLELLCTFEIHRAPSSSAHEQ